MHDEVSETASVFIERLAAGKPIAHTLVDTLSVAQLQEVADDARITWHTLSRQPDRDAAIRILEYCFQGAFASSDLQRVIDELDSPALARDAAAEPALEQLAMRSVTALSWFDPKRAMHYYRDYYTGDLGNAESVATYAMCQRVLSVAPLWLRLQHSCPIPGPLRRFMTLQWVSSADALDDIISTLREDMTSRPQEYLHACDNLVANHEPLLRYIVNLTKRYLPDSLPALGELGEDERRQLDKAMGAIDAPMSRGLRFGHLLAPVLTLGAVLSLGGLDSAALLSIGLLGGAAAAYTVRAERGAYARLARPLLAEYLAEVGTPTSCVVSWLLVNRKSVKRIKAFDVAIDSDSSLDVVARLGRMTRLHS